MSQWRHEPFFAFDLETTGIDVETDRVVTATVLRVAPRTAPEVQNWLADPGIEIPEGASKVHGISTEKARAEGRPAAEVVAEVHEALRKAWATGAPVAIYNAPYDITLLDREIKRHGGDGIGVVGPIVDGLVCDKYNDPYRPGSRKLIDCCRHYGITLSEEDAHSSAGDALAAARLAYMVAAPSAGVSVRVGYGRHAKFDNRRGRLHSMSLAELVEAQAIWSDEQKRSFAEHKRRQGKAEMADQILREMGWPLRPPPVARPEQLAEF